MIGSIGLGLVGMGVVFMWAGWKDRKVGDFFAQLRSPAELAADDFGGGDFAAPAAYNPLPPGVAGPVLPPLRLPR